MHASCIHHDEPRLLQELHAASEKLLLERRDLAHEHCSDLRNMFIPLTLGFQFSTNFKLSS